MSYTANLEAAIYIISVIGITLGAYVTYKIYTKDGFR